MNRDYILPEIEGLTRFLAKIILNNDVELSAAQFSREEILKGLQDIKKFLDQS